jgi:hypothetical protein
MPEKHLTRDLRVPRFIGTYQSKIREAEKKQESAKPGEQKPVGARTSARGCTPIVDF